MRTEHHARLPAGFVPGIGSDDFVSTCMGASVPRMARSGPLPTDDASSCVLRKIMADATYDALRRIEVERNALATTVSGGGGGSGLSPIVERGGVTGSGEPAPSIRFGRGPDGHYRDTPHRSGTVKGGTELGKASSRPVHERGGRVATTVARDLSPEARGLLDTIAGTESPGYNVRYGGARFNSYADHPRIGKVIDRGPNAGKTSNAAGRYQFLSSTWDRIARKYGLKDFSPANQDKAAWYLAQEDYAARTHGRKLEADLKSKDPAVVAGVGRALHGTWTSLPGGIEAGTNDSKFGRALAANTERERNNAVARQGVDPHPDESRRGLAAGQRDAERAVLPRPQSDLLPRPEHRDSAGFGSRIEAMAHSLPFDHSSLDEAIAKVDTLHGKLRALKATASVDINHTHTHKDEPGSRPGRLRTALNGHYGSDGRSWS